MRVVMVIYFFIRRFSQMVTDFGFLDLVVQPYHLDSTGKEPKYYQVEAINRTIEAIAAGQDRVLLVMAAGTGNTPIKIQCAAKEYCRSSGRAQGHS